MLNRQLTIGKLKDIIMVSDAHSTFAFRKRRYYAPQESYQQGNWVIINGCRKMMVEYERYKNLKTKESDNIKKKKMIFTGLNAMENKMKIDSMMKGLLPDMPSIVTVDEEREDLQETICSLLAKLGVTMEDVRSSSRKPHIVDARCMMAAYLIGLPSVRQVEIAAIFGVSQAAVSKMLRRHYDSIQYYRPYREKWESISY